MLQSICAHKKALFRESEKKRNKFMIQLFTLWDTLYRHVSFLAIKDTFIIT